MSEPNVFIIESLRPEDEKDKRFEGEFISKILHLGKKKSRYHYIRTEKEFRFFARKFAQSHYRYLHISCHGTPASLLTTLDEISFEDLAAIIGPHLKNKRLFLSACAGANQNLADLLIPPYNCLSILGPEAGVLFNDAAIFWASLYHSMFAWDSERMHGPTLRNKAQGFADMFYVNLNYFGRDRTLPKGYIHKRIVPQNGADNLTVSAQKKH